jgi:tetratricopeptide (TPR) repeat protein
MVTLVVRLADLQFLSPADLAGDLSAAEIVEAIRKQFDYLPGKLRVELSEGIATLHFEEVPSQDQAEARRLAGKAAKRAQSGEFQKAHDIYRRVIELDPTMAEARRELAMVLFELGKMAAAKDELIDALRLRPDDAWSYVVLGNIYLKDDRDFATAARFFTRALELKPKDAFALNGLAAAYHQLGDTEKATRCFDEAIESDPHFANARLGKAMLLNAEGEAGQAIKVLEAMFSESEVMDSRSEPVFAEGRKLYFHVRRDLAQSHEADAFKAVENYKAEVALLSGYPIKVRTEAIPGQLSGVVQMAWKRARDHHVLQLSDKLTSSDAKHVEAHELTHIRLEALARKAHRNRWFATTAGTRETAIRSLASDIKKLERQGYSADSIAQVVLDLVSGLCGCLFNTPLDMLIETLIQREIPVLGHTQFVSLHRLAAEAVMATTQPEIRKLTPPKVLRALSALNGTSALFLDDFTGSATDFWKYYQRLDGANLSRELFQLWKDRSDSFEPGDEYDLVDTFADVLGLREWYEWKPDPGPHQITEPPDKEGSTNPELLRQKHPAAVWFLLDALKRYAWKDTDEVRAIAFEIGMLGRTGLDYASPEKKYSLKTIPGEEFSGLHLMCLMHAGFKRFAPELDSGMDLDEPFLTALSLYEDEHGE